MKIAKFFASLFMISSAISMEGTELCPWFGKILEVEGRAKCVIEAYRSIASGHGAKHRPACDAFIDLSASLALETISAELEVVTADTRHRSFGWDSLLATGRYRLSNDIVGDPLTVTLGLTLSKVFKPARHDIAVFHHGGIECEAHIAAGKEFECMQFWTSRIWSVCGIGIADIGSPWIRGDIAWEHNWWDWHQLKAFVHSLWGLGHNQLNIHHFRGYGPIQHQSIDIGMKYTMAFENGINVSAEYAYRIYAKNCPKGANFVVLGVFYPFGL